MYRSSSDPDPDPDHGPDHGPDLFALSQIARHAKAVRRTQHGYN